MELTNNFANFFDKKIATIRTELSNEATSNTQSCEANKQPCHAEFKEFRVMSEREIEGFVDTDYKKTEALCTNQKSEVLLQKLT